MDSPYKGLVPYAEEDFEYFFGRDTEQRIVSANLRASRLTLLFGDSGVGKSSLLNAGVVRELRNDPAYSVVVVNTWQSDPRASFKQALISAEPALEVLERSPKSGVVQGLVYWARNQASDRRCRLLVIFDQFEDFFYYHPTEQTAGAVYQTFASEFARLIAAEDIPIHFLVSIRGDCLDLLYPLKSSIPNLFNNQLRIEHLSLAGARDAIIKPLDKFKEQYPDRTLSMAEPREKLAERVVEEVAQDKPSVQAPSLQLVMSQWWQTEKAAGSGELRHETFLNMGGVRDIVARHLGDTIDRLAKRDPETLHLVAGLFDDRLVTPTGRKTSRTITELIAGTGFDRRKVGDLLERLRADRILTVVGAPKDEGGRHEPLFEFAHDLMAKAAAEWFEKYDQARKLEAAEREKKNAEREAREAEARAAEMQQLKEKAEAAKSAA